MKNKFGYLKQSERKKVLLLSDDIRMHSGVGTMAKEIVLSTAHHFNWVNLGAAVKHPEEGKVLDLSKEVNNQVGIDDSYVRLVPSTGYGNAQKVRELIGVEQPDAIFIFTDPRYWTWLFEIEREIRSLIPIFWLNIWDDYPAPLYNKSYYESVDVLMAISKQTKNINELVLAEKADSKLIEYVPHGINTDHFFPMENTVLGVQHEDLDKLKEFRETVLEGRDIDFVLFYNSRNIRRKSTADTILAYKLFCDMIGKEKAKKCAFILHTDPTDPNGTDLRAVREALCDPEYNNVFFSSEKVTTAQLNLLYNIADASILLSSNEGWGLSLTESLVTATPFIANVTGGMQDQFRFEDENGEWINFSADFPSNHRGTYKKCGEWATPVFPATRSIAGSIQTPYIFDDRCTTEDAADAILKVYNMTPKERDIAGAKGYTWATGNEANFTAEKMGNRVIEVMNEGFDKFKPRERFNLHKITDLPAKRINHKLTGY